MKLDHPPLIWGWSRACKGLPDWESNQGLDLGSVTDKEPDLKVCGSWRSKRGKWVCQDLDIGKTSASLG